MNALESRNAESRQKYADASPEWKAARLAQCREWNAANPERRAAHKKYTREERAAYMRAYRAANPERAKAARQKAYNPEYQAKWYAERKEQLKPIRKIQGEAWRKANLDKDAAASAKRRAAKLQRTPSWLTPDDHWIIGEVYELCAHRTRLTGVEHHVDHIIPLQGRRVSGLHVPLNLQVIPRSENQAKWANF